MLPERDPIAEQAASLVACITADPGLRRVDERGLPQSLRHALDELTRWFA